MIWGDTYAGRLAAAEANIAANSAAITGKQPAHANLTALAGLTGQPGKLTRYMGVGSLSLGDPKRFVNAAIPAGNTIVNTTAETAFATTFTVPANSVQVGDEFGVELWGLYGCTLTPPSIIGKVKIGSVTVLDTGSVAALLGGTQGLGWNGFASFLVVTAGASGQVDAQGQLQFATSATATANIALANSSLYSIDWTVDQLVTVTAKWSAASSQNSIQLRRMVVR